MKTFVILFGVIAVFGFAACNSSTDTTDVDTIKETETVIVPGETRTIVVPVDAPAGVQVKTNPDGTQILVDKDGIEWKSKDGRTETQIRMDKDSGGRIIIKR